MPTRPPEHKILDSPDGHYEYMHRGSTFALLVNQGSIFPLKQEGVLRYNPLNPVVNQVNEEEKECLRLRTI